MCRDLLGKMEHLGSVGLLVALDVMDLEDLLVHRVLLVITE
jgi:hypothetical protein